MLAPSKKGELGTAELNHKLQAALNPKDDDKAEITIGSKTFRTGDKVMQIKTTMIFAGFVKTAKRAKEFSTVT